MRLTVYIIVSLVLTALAYFCIDGASAIVTAALLVTIGIWLGWPRHRYYPGEDISGGPRMK